MANYNVGELAKARAEAMRKTIRELMIRYPGIKNIEISDRVGLTPTAIGRHVEIIRQEWKEQA